VKRLICIGLVVFVGASIVVAPLPARGQGDEDLEKIQLMLLGVIAVHSSSVIAMEAYRAGLLTKEEATVEVERNQKFLSVLIKIATRMKERLALDEQADMTFMQDYLQVCNYAQLALDSLQTYIDGAKELDRQLFDRYVAKCEETMGRLLKEKSAEK